MLGPRLIAKEVELRPPTIEDAATYYRWMASPEVTRFVPPPPRIAEGMEKTWLDEVSSSKTQITWAIYAHGEHVGFTRVYSIDWIHRRGYGSTWLGVPDSGNHGYATEAIRLRNNFVFSKTSLEKLQAETFVENETSRRWIEQLGYRHYGVVRHHFLQDDKWHDMWLAEILRSDWLARSTAT